MSTFSLLTFHNLHLNKMYFKNISISSSTKFSYKLHICMVIFSTILIDVLHTVFYLLHNIWDFVWHPILDYMILPSHLNVNFHLIPPSYHYLVSLWTLLYLHLESRVQHLLIKAYINCK